MDIQLSLEDQAFIEDMVNEGVYPDAGHVVRAGLRLLGSQEGKLEDLRRLIQEGIDDVDAGRVMTFDEPGDLLAHILKMSRDGKHALKTATDVPARANRSTGTL